MSRILRRPMFRGGPVDSRGTGITANLGYNNGGRVGYNRGMLVQPPGASGLFSIQDILKQTGAPMTGKQILEFAKDKQLNLGRDFKINPFSKYIPENVEVQVGEDTVEKPFGEIVAKFDTGNGASASTIHADEYKVDGKSITWKYQGKTLTSKITRIAKVDVGGLNDYSEKRYGVLLDLEYAGTLYKNIEFLLDDRGNRTPILLNRKVMKMLNVMVNPDRKYITTTRYSIDK